MCSCFQLTILIYCCCLYALPLFAAFLHAVPHLRTLLFVVCACCPLAIVVNFVAFAVECSAYLSSSQCLYIVIQLSKLSEIQISCLLSVAGCAIGDRCRDSSNFCSSTLHLIPFASFALLARLHHSRDWLSLALVFAAVFHTSIQLSVLLLC